MPSQRNKLLDTLRGVALLNMLAYHLLYDIEMVYHTLPWMNSTVVFLWQRSILCTFLVLAGFTFSYNRHPYKTAAKIFVCAVIVTVATLLATPTSAVWFGVLHCIAVCTVLTALATPLLQRMNPLLACFACTVFAVMLCDSVQKGVLHLPWGNITLPKSEAMWPIIFGIPTNAAISSLDFVPLIPWLFVFLLGFFLYRICKVKQWDNCLANFRIPVITKAGQYSLLIYLISQPICFGCIYFLHQRK